MKFFERPENVALIKLWREKLERSGFQDIEKRNEELQQHNIRTQRWERRDEILDFFLALDTFLNFNQIPRKHRRILELWSKGIYLNEISVEVGMSYAWVKHIVAKYEKIVLDTY